MIVIRPIVPTQWREYRDIRLRALLDSPDAFGSTFAAEAQRSDEQWRVRIEAACSSSANRLLFALDGETLCGLA